MKRLFKQFSFPGGIPSHVAPETPGSIHEGGELGYSLSHAYRRGVRQSDLIVACVVGDGEAETGPLATSWHSNKFLNPVHDGAVLPILHLERLQDRRPDGAGAHSARGAGSAVPRLRLRAVFRRRATTRRRCTSAWPTTLDTADRRDSRHPARGAQRTGSAASALADDRPAHAQGLDRPEGGRRRSRPRATFRSHQVPMARAWTKPGHLTAAGRHGCRVTARRSCSTRQAARSRTRGSWRRQASGAWAPTRTPTAACCCAICELPDFRDYAVEVPQPGRRGCRGHARPWASSCAT